MFLTATKDYECGRKFQHYRTLSSLKSHLAIVQDAVHIEQWTRQSDQCWILAEFDSLNARVPLEAIGTTLAVADVYAGIEKLS